jgi:putative hemolysin
LDLTVALIQNTHYLPVMGIMIKSFTVSIAVSILSMILLLACSALISAAESAFFSFSPSDLEELRASGTKQDAKILQLINTPKTVLATVLISINFVNIAIVILSTFVMEALFNFEHNPMLGFIIQVVAVTFLILLIGEVIPKIYATQNPLRTSRTLLYFLLFLQRLFYPISWALVYSTSAIDKIVKPKTHNISVNELSQALELTSDEDIPEKDHQILKGIVKFGNTDVKQIMKSRMDVTAFDYNTNYKKLLEDITLHGFSRFPVYKDTLDHVAGVLYTKDLLPFLNEEETFNWQSIIRPPFFVPENKKIDDLLREFQHKKIHLAVVVDEYGGTSGIVTLEDVIEEIVGEINDEFDDDDLIYSKLDENNYVFEGKAHLNDVYRILEIDGEVFEDAKGEADTLGGLLLELEERIPRKGEKIKFENLLFTIEAADNRKIKRVKITVEREHEEDEK